MNDLITVYQEKKSVITNLYSGSVSSLYSLGNELRGWFESENKGPLG